MKFAPIPLVFLYYKHALKPIKCHCYPHIETSQLTCKANQLTSFYMMEILGFNELMELVNQNFLEEKKRNTGF